MKSEKSLKNIKNKGFTLIEIIAVLVIISLLTILIAPSLMGAGSGVKEKTYKTQQKTIEDMAIYYVQENYGAVVGTDTGTVTKTLVLKNLVPEYYKPDNYESLSPSDCLVRRPTDNACIEDSTITITIDTTTRKKTATFNEVLTDK